MRIVTRRRRTPIVPIIPLMDILVILLIFLPPALYRRWIQGAAPVAKAEES